MCLCVTNLKLCSSEQAAVLNFSRITELRKLKLKVEILHKNFKNNFSILIVFYNSKDRNLFNFQKIAYLRII